MKKNTFQNVRRAYQFRFEPENYLRVATFFWTAVFVAAVCSMVVSIVFGAWQFVAHSEAATVENAAAGISGFNREQLKTLVEVFEKRTATFETMMSGQ